ncbi:RHS repeat-associated core domain-containing protein, partial [Streptomyces sp. NPDC057386]
LSWMVDDHHGTASMTVDATTQAITRRYTKPFGETRGTAPQAWPDDKGFLGKPADIDTGLTHIGAREYDPATGRFLSVDPILAPEDHESLNGYAYANNTPVTMSDPTGLRPVTDCDRGCNTGNGGRYHDWMTPGPNGTWVYHSTQTYSQSFQYEKAGGSTGSGTMTVTIHNDGGQFSAQVVFKRGPDPKPERRDGSQCTGCWAMGTNPYYDPLNGELPDTPKLKTWQKVVLGVVAGLALSVAAAPVIADMAPGCLATAPVCFAEIAEAVTGGASGGSAVVGSSAAAAATSVARSEGAAAEAASQLPVYYNRNWAFRQENDFHIPMLITPHGRTLSNHAAERVAGSGPGRPPTTLNALDYILETGDKVKYDAARDTIQVRATQLPGKPFVVVSASNPNHIVTAMIPKKFDIP